MKRETLHVLSALVLVLALTLLFVDIKLAMTFHAHGSEELVSAEGGGMQFERTPWTMYDSMASVLLLGAHLFLFLAAWRIWKAFKSSPKSH